jgi:flagellar basal body rod protein FlgC
VRPLGHAGSPAADATGLPAKPNADEQLVDEMVDHVSAAEHHGNADEKRYKKDRHEKSPLFRAAFLTVEQE